MKVRNLLAILLMSTTLAACGAVLLAEGGISGTGIATGVITAFGSVFVNGVEYDVDQASFTRNGVTAGGQNEYRIGEYVTVTGKVNADGVTGVAETVAFDNVLLGEVTAASTDGISLEVLGQTVKTNSLTVSYGFKLLSDLTAGNVVEVSGVRDASGVLVATGIRLLKTGYLAGDESMLKGSIRKVDTGNQTFKVGNLSVDYSTAVLQGFPSGMPQAGLYVEVNSWQALRGNTLIAAEVEVMNTGLPLKEGMEVEVEGVITRFVSARDFSVNGMAVITDAKTKFEGGSSRDLSLNALVEVDGTVNAFGLIEAEEVSIKESKSVLIDELEGTITAINSATKTFTLMDATNATYRVTVDTSTIWEDESAASITQMNFSHLNVGDFLEVKSKKLSNGKLLALRIKREDGEDED